MTLPMNRFHDLVFGDELGQGSFSVVKYARHITKGKSRSDWPEFAVKVISTTKIQVGAVQCSAIGDVYAREDF